MYSFKRIFLLVFIASFLFACGVNRDSFFSRSYNSLVTKYNILYNGNIAFQEGLVEVLEKHKDDYREILPLEPITFDENKISIPSFSSSPKNEEDNEKLSGFEKSEEKAVKAIQLHSMTINGEEKNKQIDDAYLLLGKSRYYTQRFAPALEAFNFVIAKYPKADLINETRIWRAKTNYRLTNYRLAIESLKLLLKKQRLKESIKEQGYTALAMTYIKTDSIQNAITSLKLATQTSINIPQTARNLFVLGQLYSQNNQKDSAIVPFQKILDLKNAPYVFKIHSKIELAKVSLSTGSSKGLISQLQKLTEAIENQKYLDKIYYQIGILELGQNKIKSAVGSFNKSLSSGTNDVFQKTFSYEKLGDINFNQGGFVRAGLYYDSIIKVTPKNNSLRIRKIRRKHKNLSSVIRYEGILKTNDSILKLTNMSKELQTRFFENHISKLKLNDAANVNNQNFLGNATSRITSTSTNGFSNAETWYFYNRQSSQIGLIDFKKRWGDRPLEDNWRLSDKREIVNEENIENKDQTENKKYVVSTYLESLPKDKKEIDSLVYYRNDALYQTGLIYKEQFKNLPLSVDRFERLLTLNPEKTKILPVYYLLYQLYTELNDAKAAGYKKTIIEKYPSSLYATIIQNATIELGEESAPEEETLYKSLYYLYKDNEFREVVAIISEISPSIQDSNLIAKFELLKAFAIGKYQSKANYKKALELVSSKYANTEEGKRAMQIMKQLK
mgnify:CR=1 FL=1